MRKKLLSIILITILLIQCMSITLNQVLAATIFSVTVAKMDFFDTNVAIEILENTENITAFDCGGRGQETTILDHNNNINFVYDDDNYVYIQRLNSNLTVKDTLKIPKKYPEYGDATIKATSKDNSYATGYCDVEVEGNLSDEYAYEVLEDGTIKILNKRGEC